MASPWLLERLSNMADYFEYEEIHETTPRDVWTEVKEGKSNFLVVKQPHGVLSYTGMMSAVSISFYKNRWPRPSGGTRAKNI